MRLVVIGSADAYNAAGRGHACYWLESDAGVVMVDCGATALMGLGRAGLDPLRIDGLLLTHFHGDHIGGLPYLLIDQAFARGRTRPLFIVGPAGCRERVEAICRAAYGDTIPRGLSFPLEFTELAAGESLSAGALAVDSRAAEHGSEPGRALMLRVEPPGGPAVAFTGDTAMIEPVFDLARGAACLVAECTELSAGTPGHCSWEEWRDNLNRVESQAIVFTHLGAEVRAAVPSLLREAAARGPGPSVRFADDGLRLEWDQRSK